MHLRKRCEALFEDAVHVAMAMPSLTTGTTVFAADSGTAENCYYLTLEADEVGGKTAEQFASGEDTCLRNGQTFEGELAFRQTLKTGEDDTAFDTPCLEHRECNRRQARGDGARR